MEVTLMESMKHYFEYRFMTYCGIPAVTLTGSVADYKSIIERCERLQTLLPDLDVSLK